MSADPYAYPGSDVLINKENLRDQRQLDRFERLASRVRSDEGVPEVPLTAAGYRALHRHLFQDVYDWAGKDRTVDIRKDGSFFCRADYIGSALNDRFKQIGADKALRSADPDVFAVQAGDHLAELNAIHPFREGNGRTMRAFLQLLGRQAGHDVDLTRLDPVAWNAASRDSFLTADSRSLAHVIRSTVGGPAPEQLVDQGQPAAAETDWLTTLEAAERDLPDPDEPDLAPGPKR